MTERTQDTADAILADAVVGLKREIEELREQIGELRKGADNLLHLFGWLSNWQSSAGERIVALEEAREGGAVTARDVFASSVLEGMWATERGLFGHPSENYAESARLAYEQADAMMAERARAREAAE